MKPLSRQNLQFTKKILIVLQRLFFEELNDPIFRRISINHIRLNSKRTLAVVYLDIENAGENSRAVEKLRTLNPFLRKRVADELNLFKCPFLSFVNDLHFKKAMAIENLINSSLVD